MNAVELSSVVVELGARPVLGPMDQVFAKGSFTLVVGPSGSGKSTLLRTIAGLVVPKSGVLRLEGEIASDGPRLAIRPERRQVGFLFQGGGLWPHMSVQRTLEFVLSCRKVERAERAARVKEVLELVELCGLERRRPGELSGGEAQRLGLARALIVRPKLLLLDEPLGPLDARLRTALLERVAELHKRLGLTTIFVTHDPNEAEHLADRQLQMEAGQALA